MEFLGTDLVPYTFVNEGTNVDDWNPGMIGRLYLHQRAVASKFIVVQIKECCDKAELKNMKGKASSAPKSAPPPAKAAPAASTAKPAAASSTKPAATVS